MYVPGVYLISSLFCLSIWQSGWYSLFKSKLFLGQVAERNDQHRGDDFGDRRKNMHFFYEKLHKKVVKNKAYQHQQQVAEKLYPAPEGGIIENNCPHQEKTGEKADRGGDDQCTDMRANGERGGMDVLFSQYKIVDDEIEKYIEQRITAPASRIAKSLQGH